VLRAAVAGQHPRAARRGPQRGDGSGRDVVRAEDLQAHVGFFVVSAEVDTQNARPKTQPDALDKETVQTALDQANGVISVAARTLGLHRTQLYRLMSKLGILRDDT
jgi:transcriptional regulator with GAF, ATPase, and Fis domain